MTPETGNPATEFARDDWHMTLSAGTSLLLHGVALALLVVAWRAAPKPDIDRQLIPVTLVKDDAAAPAAATQSAVSAGSAASEAAAPSQAAAPPATALTKSPPVKPALARPLLAKPTLPKSRPAKPPPRAAATPTAPSEDFTALLQEGVAGRPLASNGAGQSGIALRSSAPVSDDYRVVLQDWLARFQRYPEDAQAKHEEGKGVVGFTLARDGQVERVWMDQSTGAPSLDRATIAMVQAASPVPPLPKDFVGATIDFFLPVSYTLSTYQRLFQ